MENNIENFFKKNKVKEGKVYTINDSKTRGHKTLITKIKNSDVKHIPLTHSPKTRNMKNIELMQNFDLEDTRVSYILPKQQISNIKNVGKFHPTLKPRNSIDKSIIRHIKKS